MTLTAENCRTWGENLNKQLGLLNVSFETVWRLETREGEGPFAASHAPEVEEAIENSSTFYASFLGWHEEMWYSCNYTFLGRGATGLLHGLSLVTAEPRPERWLNAFASLDALDKSTFAQGLRAGCKNASTLLTWLEGTPGLRELLHAEGYVLSVYQVIPEALFLGAGENAQAAFYGPAAELVTRFSLVEHN